MAMNEKIGVILDEPYLNALICQSIVNNEGFIEFSPREMELDLLNLDVLSKIEFDMKIVEEVWNPNPWSNRYAKTHLQSGLNIINREKTLALLLLFGKGYYFPVNQFIFDKLKDEGLLEPVPPKLYASNMKSFGPPFDRSFAIQNAPLIVSMLRVRGVKINIAEFRNLLSLVRSREVMVARRIYANERVGVISKKCWVTTTNGRKEEIILSKLMSKNLVQKLGLIDRETCRLQAMILASSKLEKPTKSNINLDAIPALTSEFENAEATLRAYKLYLNEVTLVPRLRTIQDVLRLRDDPRVEAFRTAIFSWADALSEGDIEEETRIRREIRKASKNLAKLGAYRKVAGWVSVVSIPISIASALTGVPAGLALTPIGPAIAMGTSIKEKKLQWLLFGK